MKTFVEKVTNGYCLLLLSFLLLVARIDSNCSFHCEAYNCPCECIRKEIRCDNQNVSQVFNFPTHVNYEMIDFGNNEIKSLKKHHFKQENMQSLLILQLSANKIESIDDHTFYGLQQLQSLFLNSNQISVLSKHTFSGLHKLRRLYLNNNKLKLLQRHAFKALQQTLRLLYLQNNDISFIENETFKNFRQLRTLDLSGNKLKFLDGRFLRSSPSIAHLFLGENPWTCDERTVCLSYGSIKEKQGVLSREKLTLRDDMICQTPERFQLKNMAVVIQLFDCEVLNFTATTLVTTTHNNGKSGSPFVNPDTWVLIGCFAVWSIISLSLAASLL